MNVLSITVFAACAVALTVLVPIYVNCLSNKKPYKLKKMICSSLFILQALAAVLYNGGFSVFSALMLAGLVLSWIGDLFLAVSLKGTPFILGLASFLLAHVMYVISFSRSISDISESARIKPFEFAVVIIMLIVCLIVKKKAKINLGEMAVPVLFYALAISFMLARAVRLSLLCVQNEMAFVSVIMILAAVLFVASDSVLVFIIFKDLHGKKVEGANLYTYYAAQVLLASSIFFLG